MGAGCSRGCVEKVCDAAVRPQEKNSEESRWAAGIAEDGVEVARDVVEEPDSGGVDDDAMGGKRECVKWEIHFCRVKGDFGS